MHCSNCGVCCTETEMLLGNRDIKRLEKLGYHQGEFVKFDKQGYAQLQNKDGYCIFYDRKNHRCKVYMSRPSGCRVYPVIVDEDSGIILDAICESRHSITDKEKILKGHRVIKLLRLIDNEAAARLSK